MNDWKLCKIEMVMIMAMMLSLAGGSAFAAGSPLTPERAAQREITRKQLEQRVTDKERKAAAESLKTERLKVHQARQAVQGTVPIAIDSK